MKLGKRKCSLGINESVPLFVFFVCFFVLFYFVLFFSLFVFSHHISEESAGCAWSEV